MRIMGWSDKFRYHPTQIKERIFLNLVLCYRCTRVYNPEAGTDINGRHSSSADEGFTSGSSPVNGTTSNVPILLSPQSSDTQDTTHLVSSSSSSTTSSKSSTCSSSPYPPPIAPRKPIRDCLARESTV